VQSNARYAVIKLFGWNNGTQDEFTFSESFIDLEHDAIILRNFATRNIYKLRALGISRQIGSQLAGNPRINRVLLPVAFLSPIERKKEREREREREREKRKKRQKKGTRTERNPPRESRESRRA